MALPFFIAALSFGYAVVPPDIISSLPSYIKIPNQLLQQNNSSKQQQQQHGSSSSSSNNYFFSGVVFGMGLSTLISYELRRRRILERIRVGFFSWLYYDNTLDDDDNKQEKLVDKYRKPVHISELVGEKMIMINNNNNNNNNDTSSPESGNNGNDDVGNNNDETTNTNGNDNNQTTTTTGYRCELLSPDWAFTSNYNVTMLTLIPGTELLAKKTNSVEFYYVIEGDGILLRSSDNDDNDEDDDDDDDEDNGDILITTGNAFIVDPGQKRGFVVCGRKDLILLRTTDYNNSLAISTISATIGLENDETRLFQQQRSGNNNALLSSTVSVVKAALNKVENMVTTYYASSSSSTSPGDDKPKNK